jgi:hypothetical protein
MLATNFNQIRDATRRGFLDLWAAPGESSVHHLTHPLIGGLNAPGNKRIR